MEEKIIEFLKRKEKESDLNFGGLLEIAIKNNLIIKDIGIRVGPGMSDGEIIYLDTQRLEMDNPILCFFIIAHEFAHQLRFNKKPKNYAMDLFKNKTFEEFIELGIYEEMFANKLASLIYYKLNKKKINFYMSHYQHKQNIQRMKPLFDMVNSGMSYSDILKDLTYFR